MADSFDLVIVGAGIVGTMTAYLAHAQDNGWRILLLDRSFVGDGSTRYSLGLDIPYGRSTAQKHLSETSTRIFEKLHADFPDLPLHRLPLYGVVSEKQAEAVMGGFTQTVRRAGEEDVQSLRRSYPGLSLSENQTVLAGCDCVYTSPQLFATRLVERLRRSSRFECWEGVEVRQVNPEGGGFKLMSADGRTIDTRRVLLATGPWLLDGPCSGFAKDAGVRIKKTAALHIAHRPRTEAPVLFFFDEDAFLLPRHEQGEMLFSFTSQEWNVEPEISKLKISSEDRELALSILRRYCPPLVDDCRGGRVFCDAYSPDRMPVIQQLPGIPNLVVAGACSGSGYRLAPAIAHESLKQFS